MWVNSLFLLIGVLQFQSWKTIASSALAITSSQVQPSSTGYSHASVTQTSKTGKIDESAATVLGSLYHKSRQSRCVRCYEDRYGDDRSRNYGSYSVRPADERSNWYYPSDRYDDRYRSGDRDYDRYYYEYYRYNRDRDDRYIPRPYDRYEGRGHDRYDDRRGSYYDRSESRGYGYDNRDRYIGADRYSDYYSASKNSDRYNDRPRVGSVPPLYGYDRDTYDRFYPRYDIRYYFPWDETYRGESGFDSAGRGYYFATNSGSRYGIDSGHGIDYVQNQNSYYRPSSGGSAYLPQPPRPEKAPCGVQVSDCPYAGSGVNGSPIGGGSYTSTATSQTIYSGSHNGSGTQIITTNKDGSNKGWKYVHDIDASNGGDRGDFDRDRDHDRNQQSSPYGGRPARPLGGSYLLDRDSNVVSEAGTSASDTDAKMTQENAVNVLGPGSQDRPEPAALTSEKQSNE